MFSKKKSFISLFAQMLCCLRIENGLGDTLSKYSVPIYLFFFSAELKFYANVTMTFVHLLYVYCFSVIIYLFLELASPNELSFILNYIPSQTNPFYFGHVILLVQK